MKVDDFFTSSELKDGLTSPDRVNELITVLQNEKDSVVNDFGQAVAKTIAATENKNCLDLFINLDGLYFINRCLKDAQKLENDTDKGFLEELIISLLKALERLQIDNQRLLASEIRKTVQDLVDYNNPTVRDKAKSLCDSWMLIQDVRNDEIMALASKDTVQEVIVNNDEIRTQDNIMDTEITNHDPSCKSPHEDSNLLVKFEGQPDVKDEKEINLVDKVEMSSLSSHLEQIASSADVDNPLESCIKTDVKDEDMVDDGESESPKTSSNSESVREDDSAIVGVQSNEKSGNESRFFQLSMNACGNGVKSKTSDMELEYGMIDPLEVARQVAMEVEREIDSRERSCSTSDTMSGDGNGRGSPPVDRGPSPSETEPVKDAETLVSEREISKPGITTASQISEVAQVSEANTERGFSGFDLNQEVCSEEVDNPVDPISSTISVVSASWAAAAAGLPTAPLQFEGTLGWKGSSSTSAFRCIPGTHNNSKQRLDCLDIDLNVAEEGICGIGIPSGEESSVDANPRRPERLQLDLNSIGDEGGGVERVNQNGWQSPSRSSSSSSKQPSVKNIDLNMNHQPNFMKEESVISIFGTKLEVKRKDSLPHQTVDYNLGQPGVGSGLGPSIHPYGNPPMYGHNGFASGPAMFYPTHMYGSPPYMVDSRGAPFVGQIMGSQPPSPFIMNMAAAGTSSGSSGAGPSHHNLDLNTGFMIDGGNRVNNGGLRQFFPHNNSLLQASSSSVVGGKHHEPESGFEFFPVNKRQPPPWR